MFVDWGRIIITANVNVSLTMIANVSRKKSKLEMKEVTISTISALSTL